MSEQAAAPTPSLTPSGRAGTLADGTVVTLDCGAPEAEAEALQSTALRVDRTWRGAIELVGADRHRFLNGLMTCDVKTLADGAGVYGFLTDAKGRIVADGVVVSTGDALRVDLPRMRLAGVVEHLRKYIISDRVEVEVAPLRSFLLAGPGAARAWRSIAGVAPPDEPWAATDAAIGNASVWAVDERRIGTPALAVWTNLEEAAGVFEAFADVALAGGYRVVDDARIVAGVPWYGVDYGGGDSHIPQETSLASAVDFEKGCYLGQEVVARVHFLGRASRSLQRLRSAPGVALERSGALISNGRRVGEVTSACGRADEALGIGFVHHSVSDENLDITDEAGNPVEVAELPAV